MAYLKKFIKPALFLLGVGVGGYYLVTNLNLATKKDWNGSVLNFLGISDQIDSTFIPIPGNVNVLLDPHITKFPFSDVALIKYVHAIYSNGKAVPNFNQGAYGAIILPCSIAHTENDLLRTVKSQLGPTESVDLRRTWSDKGELKSTELSYFWQKNDIFYSYFGKYSKTTSKSKEASPGELFGGVKQTSVFNFVPNAEGFKQTSELVMDYASKNLKNISNNCKFESQAPARIENEEITATNGSVLKSTPIEDVPIIFLLDSGERLNTSEYKAWPVGDSEQLVTLTGLQLKGTLKISNRADFVLIKFIASNNDSAAASVDALNIISRAKKFVVDMYGTPKLEWLLRSQAPFETSQINWIRESGTDFNSSFSVTRASKTNPQLITRVGFNWTIKKH